MNLNRFAPILALGLCSGPDQTSPDQISPVEPHPEAAIPDPGLQQALDKIHKEASGPHCAFTAIALEKAKFIQSPDGIRIQMGSRVFRVLRRSGAETVVLESIPTEQRPDKKCMEVDGIPENDIEWYDCGGS